MKYKIRLSIAGIICILSILAVCGLFHPVKFMDIQLIPLLQRVIFDFSIPAIILFLGIIVLTLLFGRFYCSIICPLGILQEFAMLIKNGKKNPTCKNYNFKYLIAGLTFGALFGGSAILIRYIDPYTIFSSAISLSIFGIVFILIIFITLFFKNRFFCINICPVGTILGLISKFSLNKIYIDKNCTQCGACSKCPSGCIHPSCVNAVAQDKKEFTVDNETCIKCLKCLSICPNDAIKYGINKTKKSEEAIEKKVKFNPKRRSFIWGMGALAMLGAGYAMGINFAKNISQKIKNIILPAGAENMSRMINKCLNCNLCVINCPNKILTKADDEFPVVHIDYSKGKRYCKYNCNKCSEVCPSGAIKKISLEEKHKIKIATAKITPQCTGCGKCIEKCPVHAIITVKSDIQNDNETHYVVIDENKCMGCGKCAIICKSQAIKMYGVSEQNVL